jgi:hypothetical protein
VVVVLDMTFEDEPLSVRNSASAGDQVKLAALWRDILGVSDVMPEDNFFDLGGHSLLLTRLMFHIKYGFFCLEFALPI